MSSTGIWGDTFIVVGAIDPSLNGREVICCNFGFEFNHRRNLWEAWFSTLDTREPVILSPHEIMYPSQYKEYLEMNSIYM